MPVASCIDLGRQADLAADEPAAGGDVRGAPHALHRVRVLDRHAGVARGEQRHRGAVAVGGGQLVGDRRDGLGGQPSTGHSWCPSLYSPCFQLGSSSAASPLRRVGEPVGADGDLHLAGVRAGDDRLRVAVEVEHEGGLGVPGRDDRVAPPVAALVVVDVPRDDRVVGVAGVVVLRVDLDAVAVGVAQVQVERVGHAVAAGAALDRGRSRRSAPSLSQIARMLCFSWVANATWCMRGPSPPVIAVSCTVGLRRIHAA